MQPRVLITGATGILGSYVLAGGLDRGYRCAVLMRDASEADARRRLAQILQLTGSFHTAREIELIRADVRQPFLGLPSDRLVQLRMELDLVIHCAASVSFEPAHNDLIWQTNVQGTQNLIELIARTGIPLYYVSTAYIGGARRGLVYETELEVGQEFNNHYERSKVQTEQLLQKLFSSGALSGGIFRPSIIVGAARDGHIAQFLNFYGFMRLVDGAKEGRLPVSGNTRIQMDPAVTKNIVPVDWAAEAIWQIIERAGATGRVYHLTNPSPPLQAEIVSWANNYLGGSATFEALTEIAPPLTRLERVAQKQLKSYLSYMLGECQFDRSNTEAVLNGSLPFPRTDAQFFELVMSYARERQWKKLFYETNRDEEDLLPKLIPQHAT